VIGQMFAGAPGRILLEPWHFGLAAGSLLLGLAEEHWSWFENLMLSPAWAQAAALSLMLVCLEIFGVVDVSIPFVYFQF